MLAVIKSGGKQYIVSPNDKIKVQKLSAEEGKEVVFDEVLLVSDDKQSKVGSPLVSGAKVTAKVLRQGREKKTSTLKYRSKVRYRRHQGFRQNFTEVQIQDIKF